MQGRAAAVYALVFLLAAAASFAYVATAETPEPTMEDPEVTAEEGEDFPVTGPDGQERSYTVGEFDPDQQGQPAVTLLWTDEDARSTEEWEHAAEPGGTTVVYEGTDHYVRIPQGTNPDDFTLLQAPPEDGDVSLLVDDGNWVVNDSGEYVPLAEYEGLNRVTVQNGSTFEEGAEEQVRTVRVEEITNETVTVSWNDPSETEVLLRQTDREELNGVNVTAHIPEQGVLHLTSDEAEIERYLQAHDDRVHFQQRVDGLIATTVLSLVALGLLLGLAFLPRKE